MKNDRDDNLKISIYRSLSLVTESEDKRANEQKSTLGNFIVNDSAPSRWTFP